MLVRVRPLTGAEWRERSQKGTLGGPPTRSAAKRAQLAALRPRVGLLSASVGGGRLQEQRPKRWQSQRQAVAVAVGADRDRLDAAQVALAAPSIERRVAVQQLQPPARLWDSDLVVLAWNRREVEHADDDVLR